MSGKTIWEPRTKFKETLHRLTKEWGSKKEVAAKAGVAESSLGTWSKLSTPTLPNVEQAYFIAQALDQNLLDMLAGQIRPTANRLASDEERLLHTYRRLLDSQKRFLLSALETAAAAAGITQTPADTDKQEQAG